MKNVNFVTVCVVFSCCTLAIIIAIVYSRPTCDTIDTNSSLPWKLMPVGLVELPDMTKTVLWDDRSVGVLTENSVWGKNGFYPRVLDQGGWKSCTAFSMRYAYLLWLAKSPRTIDVNFEPSLAFIYAKSRLLLNGNTKLTDFGSTTSATVQVMRTLGIPHENEWTYTAPNIFEPPPPFSVLTTPLITGINGQFVGNGPFAGFKKLFVVNSSNNLPQWKNQASYFISEIDAGRSILVSIICYQNLVSENMLRTGVIPNPSGKIIGGHAICLVGYERKSTPELSVFTFYNSWGPYTGFYKNSPGLFSIPFKYVANAAYSGDWYSL